MAVATTQGVSHDGKLARGLDYNNERPHSGLTGYTVGATLRTMPATIKPLFVKLTAQDKACLAKLAADSGAAVGHPVPLSSVGRLVVRDAARKGTPVRIRLEERA